MYKVTLEPCPIISEHNEANENSGHPNEGSRVGKPRGFVTSCSDVTNEERENYLNQATCLGQHTLGKME